MSVDRLLISKETKTHEWYLQKKARAAGETGYDLFFSRLQPSDFSFVLEKEAGRVLIVGTNSQIRNFFADQEKILREVCTRRAIANPTFMAAASTNWFWQKFFNYGNFLDNHPEGATLPALVIASGDIRHYDDWGRGTTIDKIDTWLSGHCERFGVPIEYIKSAN